MAHNLAALRIHDLTVAYHKTPVIEHIELFVEPGSLVGIVGPNGAGKSTLIKASLGLIPTVSGEVSVFGKPVKEQRKLIGYVPQRESVDWDFPTNALDVVTMGTYGRLSLFRRPGAKEKATALACLAKVGMSDFANRQISQLSGGQQQRIFLARALAQEAELYVMDEPFAGVDAATEKAIVALLTDLRDQGKTVLVVHHDLTTVKEYFDTVLLLNKRVVAYGPTGDIFNRDHLQRTYGGKLAIFDARDEALLVAGR